MMINGEQIQVHTAPVFVSKVILAWVRLEQAKRKQINSSSLHMRFLIGDKARIEVVNTRTIKGRRKSEFKYLEGR